MTKIITVLISIVVITILVAYLSKRYNKMVLLQAEISRNYQQFNMVIQEQVYLLRSFYTHFSGLNYTEFLQMKEDIEHFDSRGSIYNVMKASISLDKEFKRLAAMIPPNQVGGYINNYTEIYTRLNRIRDIYNKNIKEFNNIVETLPMLIVAKAMNYKSWPVFSDFR